MIFLNILVVFAGTFIGSFLLQFVVMLLGVAVYILIEKRIANLPKYWRQVILVSFLSLSSFGFTLLWQETRASTIRDIQMIARFMHWGLFNLFVAFLVLGVGRIAYWGKKTHQFRYGIVEILVAL